ncbi:YesL family protein [Alkalicoccobacillus gibsonii]|uniref:YesL family protein n=1 Tax=Alkalicoccobacillus gibsonii TaxID=79881 RepID=UPI003F7C34F8
MTQWYMRVGHIGFNLILLNILWLAGTLTGFIVLGLFPATMAVVAVVKHMVLEDDNPPIIKLFLRHFRSNLLMANVFGYVMTSLGVVLTVDLMWVWQMEDSLLQQCMLGLSVLITLVYLVACLYLFPIYLHYQFSFKEYFIQAVVLAIGKPVQTILLLLIVTLMSGLYVIFPPLLFVFGLGAIVYPVLKITCYSFAQKETNHSDGLYSQ